MRLDELPEELLIRLPDFLDSLDDLYALLRVSRIFYRTCFDTKATFPPLFAKRDGQALFSDHLILSGVARQVGDWAVKAEESRGKLHAAISNGNDGLLALANEVSRMSLNDVRALYRAQWEITSPVSKLYDLHCGSAEGLRPSRHDPRPDDEEYWTICEDVDTAIYNFIIYCELFHLDIESSYNPCHLKPLGPQMRVHWVSFCMPDGLFPEALHHFPGECQIMDFHQIEQSDPIELGIVKGLFGTIENWTSPGFSDHYPQEWLLHNVMRHQGLATLRISLDQSTTAIQDLTDTIREKTNSVPSSKIHSHPRYDGDDQIGWLSMHYDTLVAIGAG